MTVQNQFQNSFTCLFFAISIRSFNFKSSTSQSSKDMLMLMRILIKLFFVLYNVVPLTSIALERKEEYSFIVSDVQSYDNKFLCLSAPSYGSELRAYECNDKLPHQISLQSWRFDNLGRIHSFQGNNLCIQKKNADDLILGNCNVRNKWSNTFDIDSTNSTIVWQKNPTKVIGMRLEDSDRSVIKLEDRKGSQNRIGQEWSFVRSIPLPSNVIRYGSFTPGKLNVRENGLLLSAGLTSRIIARSGQFVAYVGGFISNERFHHEPDGAATFKIHEGPNKGG